MLVNRVKGWSGVALYGEHEPKNNRIQKSYDIFGFDSENVVTFLGNRGILVTFVFSKGPN